MTHPGITDDALERQEATFAAAFAAGQVERTRPLYSPDVVYVSPTVRLFDWPRRLEGVDRTLEFVALTVRDCRDVAYAAVESACLAGGRSAFVHVHFDWSQAGYRLRSSYVVLYRYRGGRIARQELFYDPSARPEVLGRSGNEE